MKTLFILSTALLVGCGNRDQEARIAKLEARVSALAGIVEQQIAISEKESVALRKYFESRQAIDSSLSR